MKTKTMKPCSIILSLALATMSYAETTSESSQSEARAEAHAEAHGNGSQTMKQTVTVTSDGNRTIKTTTTERNGVREVKREVIDAQARVIEAEDLAEKLKRSTFTIPLNNFQHGGGDKKQELPKNEVWLGVIVESATSALRDQLDLAADEGVVIVMVGEDTPAVKAGLKPNDIILTIDGKKITDHESLRSSMKDKKTGDQVSLVIIRKGQKSTKQIILEKRPAPKNQSSPAEDPEQESSSTTQTGTAELELKYGDSFEKILKDPQVPETFKQSVREMQQRMKEFQEKHQSR